ncbi:LysE family translocator [Halomonas halmophila]|uniref:Lysine transporter LysE n=1 Tax=Halomonas halmophila TaxID=252 RepID=A0A4Y4EUD4_9GAMM|nr:LysE family translocator [Halomonas halmophila]GED21522.1 hypothetical protein HHA01_04990 [Halomonas halmophila]
MSQWLPYTLFAFAATASPGPTNLLVMAMAGQVSMRRVLPVVVAACASAALIVLMAGAGAASFLQATPWLRELLSWLGGAWLTWLAWRLASASPPADDSEGQVAPTFQVGVARVVGLQVINPKVWMMGLSVFAMFAGPDASLMTVMLMALIFFVLAVISMTLWGLMGRGAARWLATPRRRVIFNRVMATMLLGMTWWGLFH